MNLISLLLDIGNIIFFLSNFPQVLTAYRNRKNLRSLSSLMLLGFSLSTTLFVTVGILTVAPFTVVLGIGNILFFLAQFYWKRKYR